MRRRLVALAVTVAALVAVVPSLAATTTPVRNVAIKDDYYKPSSPKIDKGTKIVWTWRGEGRHNVVVVQGPSEFRSEIKREGTYSHKFKKTGVWHLTCTVHPGMNMKVTVKKPS